MSGSIANIDITGPVAIRTGQQVGSDTIGLFFNDDEEVPGVRPFMQVFGTEADLRAFAESILHSLTVHTSSRPTGEPS